VIGGEEKHAGGKSFEVGWNSRAAAPSWFFEGAEVLIGRLLERKLRKMRCFKT